MQLITYGLLLDKYLSLSIALLTCYLTEIQCIERNTTQCNRVTISWNFPSHPYNCTNYGTTIINVLSDVSTGGSARVQLEECAQENNRHFYQRCSAHFNLYQLITADCEQLNYEVTITAGSCTNGVSQFNITLIMEQLINSKD